MVDRSVPTSTDMPVPRPRATDSGSSTIRWVRCGSPRTPSGGRRRSGRGELPGLRTAPGTRAHRGAGPDQGRGGPGERRTEGAGSGHRDRDPGGGGGGRVGPLGRPLPGGRVPDRLGHLLEHERQRGDRHPRHRTPGAPGPSQRPRERLPVIQRRLPVLHPHRGHRRRHRRPDPGARSSGRFPGAEIGRIRGGREVRPYAPDGRHPGHPRPGVRRVRGAGRVRGGAAARLPARLAELPLGGTAVGTGINTRPASPPP